MRCWLVILLSGWFWVHYPLSAQQTVALDSSRSNPFSVGQVLFDKLKKTQDEYRRAIASGDSLEIAETCYLMGKRYAALGDYLAAHRWYIRSLQIREPRGPSEGMGKLYARLAENYIIQGNYPDALVYAHRALYNSQRAKSPTGLLASYETLAGIHLWRTRNTPDRREAGRSLDSARYYYRLSEPIADSLPDRKHLASLYDCMSGAYHSDPPKAIYYLKRALTIFTEEQYPFGQLNILKHLAKIYLDLNQLKAARRALDEASQLRDRYQIADFNQNHELEIFYAKFYQASGNWEQAFRHQEKAHAFEKVVQQANQGGAMSRLSIEYETGKKEAQLKAQQEHLRLQQRLTLAITVLLVLAAGMSVVFFYLFRKNRRFRYHNMQLVYEQSHRVKNNLQVISSLLSLQSNRLADQTARQAVEESQLRVEVMSLLHRRLYDQEQLVDVDLRKFIPDLINRVLQVYGLDELQPQYDLAPVWLHIDKAIPLGLVVNEVVTNCCKYAFRDHPKPVLQVAAHQKSDLIFIQLADNGPGFTLKQSASSFGLRLVELQTRQLKGIYNYDNNNRGSSFTLSFKP